MHRLENLVESQSTFASVATPATSAALVLSPESMSMMINYGVYYRTTVHEPRVELASRDTRARQRAASRSHDTHCTAALLDSNFHSSNQLTTSSQFQFPVTVVDCANLYVLTFAIATLLPSSLSFDHSCSQHH